MTAGRLLALLGALLAMSTLTLSAGDVAWAAERKAKPRTRRVQSVKPKTYKQLTSVQKKLAEDDFIGAIASLDKLAESKRLNSYERALVYQTYAFAYSGKEQYVKAIDAFEKCLATGAMPASQALDIRYNMGQLYLVTGNPRKGIDTLEAWFEVAENPAPTAYILVANAYIQLEDHASALIWAEKAVAKAKQPRETWLQLLMALYFEKKDFPKVAGVLERLVARAPEKKQYWLQLSAIYSELKQDRKSLATMELAYRQGVLTKSDELVRLAQLYLFHETPDDAAELLAAGLESGAIESERSSWELLADSRIRAKDYALATEPLRRAAELSDDGRLYVRLAQVFIEKEQWDRARGSLRSAFKKGELKRPGMAHLLMGISSFKADRTDAARSAFSRAAKYEKYRSSAREWLKHMDAQAAN